MSDFDILLYRPLRSGREYEMLFPKSDRTSTALGEGMTDFSILHMHEMVEEYSWQVEKVAPLLQKRSLADTCGEIHDFLFNHFQYKADDADQMLRSPQRSWADRKDGIDCKSYSILASCLLRQMGYSHYLRKIKQPGYEPNDFTHVYVIVPIDQQSGSLAKGYYVIDGTIDETDEPAFVSFKDEFMSGLPHYKLNGPRTRRGMGLKIDLNSVTSNCSSSATNPNEIKKLYPAGLQMTLQGCGLLSEVNTANLNRFLAIMTRMDLSGKKLADVGGCTGDAGTYLRKIVQQTIAAVLSALQQSGYTLTPGGKAKTNFTFVFGTYNQGKPISTEDSPSDTYTVSGGSGALQFDINTLNLTIGSGGGTLPVVDIDLSSGHSGSGSSGSSGSGSAGSGTGTGTGTGSDDPGKDKSIFTTGNIIMGSAALGLLYLFTRPSETNKSKSQAA